MRLNWKRQSQKSSRRQKEIVECFDVEGVVTRIKAQKSHRGAPKRDKWTRDYHLQMMTAGDAQANGDGKGMCYGLKYIGSLYYFNCKEYTRSNDLGKGKGFGRENGNNIRGSLLEGKTLTYIFMSKASFS